MQMVLDHAGHRIHQGATGEHLDAAVPSPVVSLWPLFGVRMESIARLSWRTEEETIGVRSADEAVRIVQAVDREYRGTHAIAVQITRADGEVMMVVVGADRSCLGWFPTGYDGVGSFHSVAPGFDPDVDELPANPEVLTYHFHGLHSEAPLQFTVPMADAFESVREFVSTPGRPQAIRWDAD